MQASERGEEEGSTGGARTPAPLPGLLPTVLNYLSSEPCLWQKRSRWGSLLERDLRDWITLLQRHPSPSLKPAPPGVLAKSELEEGPRTKPMLPLASTLGCCGPAWG